MPQESAQSATPSRLFRRGARRPAARLAVVVLLLAPWLCCPLHASSSAGVEPPAPTSASAPPCPHHDATAAVPDQAPCGDDCGPELPAGSTPDSDAKPALAAGFEAASRPDRRLRPEPPGAGLARPPPLSTPVLRSDVLLA